MNGVGFASFNVLLVRKNRLLNIQVEVEVLVYNLWLLDENSEEIVNAFFSTWELANEWKDYYEKEYSGKFATSGVASINVRTRSVIDAVTNLESIRIFLVE